MKSGWHIGRVMHHILSYLSYPHHLRFKPLENYPIGSAPVIITQLAEAGSNFLTFKNIFFRICFTDRDEIRFFFNLTKFEVPQLFLY